MRPVDRASNHLAQELWFTQPGEVELRTRVLDAPGPGEVRVRAMYSAISSGTECLAYRGEIPEDLILDESLPGYGDKKFSYPFRYGYSLVGEVIGFGAGHAQSEHRISHQPKSKIELGSRVFAFHPHASLMNVAIPSLISIPPFVDTERALFFSNMETAINMVLDAAPMLGERVAVIGQGVVGLLTTSILARFPLQELAVIDQDSNRERRGQEYGATHCGWSKIESRYDLIFECSGNPDCIQTAINHADQEARIVVGSWYGNKPAELHLGQRFHRRRIRLISSQVSQLPGFMGPRWSLQRRHDWVWQCLAALNVETWISHRVPLREASMIYRQLAGPPQGHLASERPFQAVFEYNS